MTYEQLAALSEEELEALIQKSLVWVKLTPKEKKLIHKPPKAPKQQGEKDAKQKTKEAKERR